MPDRLSWKETTMLVSRQIVVLGGTAHFLEGIKKKSKDEDQKDKYSWKIWNKKSKEQERSERKCRSGRDLSTLPLMSMSKKQY